MVRVHITGLHDFSPTELSVLEELHAAKLEELHAARARYMRPNPNAAIAARLADSGTGPTPRFSGVDAGNPRPEKPALSPRPDAIVAWDLTLRCPACNSTVEGRCNDYHCYSCERAGR
jgi:hypothetical protein